MFAFRVLWHGRLGMRALFALGLGGLLFLFSWVAWAGSTYYYTGSSIPSWVAASYASSEEGSVSVVCGLRDSSFGYCYSGGSCFCSDGSSWSVYGPYSCAAGQEFSDQSGGGVCHDACPSGGSWSNGACSCPSGQHVDGSSCVSDAPQVQCNYSQCVTPTIPEPTSGDGKNVGVVVCQPPADCSASSNWTAWPSVVNDGGWEWAASSPSACFGTTVVTCNTNIVYQGHGAAALSAVVDTLAASGSDPNATNVQPCPSGYSRDASGICVQPSQSGSPSTSSSPGSSPTAGSATCPVGYSQSPSGTCVAATAAGAYGCPAGYSVNASGFCESSPGLPGLSGQGTGGGSGSVTGQCGAPGEPPCQIDWGAWTQPGPDSGLETGKTQFEGSLSSQSQSVLSMLTDMATWSDFDGLLSWTWLPELPATSCEAPSFSVAGHTVAFSDWCERAAMIRDLGGFALYFFAAFVLFSIVTNSGGKH